MRIGSKMHHNKIDFNPMFFSIEVLLELICTFEDKSHLWDFETFNLFLKNKN